MEALKKTGLFSDFAVRRMEESSKEDLKNEIIQSKEWLKKYTVFGPKLTDAERQAESERLDNMSENDMRKEALVLEHKLDLIQKKKAEIKKGMDEAYAEGVKNGTRIPEGWPDPSHKRPSGILSPALSKEQLKEIEAETVQTAQIVQAPYDRIADECLHESAQRPVFNSLRELSGIKETENGTDEKTAAILANKYEYIKGSKAAGAAIRAKARTEKESAGKAAPAAEKQQEAPAKTKAETSKKTSVIQKAKRSVRALRANITREINKRRFGR